MEMSAVTLPGAGRNPGAGLLVWAAALALAVLLIPALASADQYVGGIPLETVREGTVSGELWFDSLYGIAGQPVSGPNTVTKAFALPDHTRIDWARLYVAVYCGHMEYNYEGMARIKFDGNGDGSFEKTLGTETLDVPYSFPAEGGTGPVWLNDHCNRVSSDYLMWYDVTDLIRARTVTAEVYTDKNTGYTGTFDGRVKLITLVVAYDDGDGDQVVYRVNQGHDMHSYKVEEVLHESYTGETSFALASLPEGWETARLVAVYMASESGIYTLNSEDLDATSPQGSYAGSEVWDATDIITSGETATFTYERTGSFFKIPLALLSVRTPAPDSGDLVVTSTPAGARVLIDGEDTGSVTNTTIYGVPVGDHMITVDREHYTAPPGEWVSVEKGAETAVHFDLGAICGAIAVTSDPDGARILIDGEDTGCLTDATLEEVCEGSHTVTVQRDGYLDASQEVVVAEGETAEAVFTLVPATAGSGSDGGGEYDGYTGRSLSLESVDTYHGGVICVNASEYSGLIGGGGEYAYSLPLALPENASVRSARLYLYTTWGHDAARKTGAMPSLSLRFNETALSCAALYTDRKGEGSYDYILATAAYDVTEHIGRGGEYTALLRNTGGADDTFAAYGLVLLVQYDDPAAPEVTCWICEGCDAVLADTAAGISTEEAATSASFDGTLDTGHIQDARLILVSTAASGVVDDEHVVTFNEGEWYNLLTAGSSGISVGEIDVRSFLLESGNRATIASLAGSVRGDYIENRNAVLVVTRGDAAPTGTADGTVPSPDAPDGAERTEIPLALEGGRIPAAHYVLEEGVLELYVAEGTALIDGAGEPVTSLWVAPVTGAGMPVHAWTIGPEEASSDIAMVLTARPGSGRTSPAFARWDSGEGRWLMMGGEFDPASGSLSCRIFRLGTYAIVDPEGASPGPDGSPAGILREVIGSLIQSILSLIGLADDSGREVVAGVDLPPVEPAPAATSSGESVSPPPFCNLSVRSSPSAALVSLDGEFTGRTTPVTFEGVLTGDHLLKVEMDGFSPCEQTIALEGDDEVTVELVAHESTVLNRLKFDGALSEEDIGQVGGIFVDSRPEEASIYIDGKRIDLVTPEVVYGLKEGSHSVKVRKTGTDFNAATKSVWVRANQITAVMFDKDESSFVRTFRVESDEFSGLSVTLNGRYAGLTIPASASVTGIDPYLTVRNGTAYLSHLLTGVRDGETVKVQEPEDRTLGNVLVESDPAGADISVDGFATGAATPFLIRNLSDGPHTISLSRPGYLPAEERIWVVDYVREVDESIRMTLDPYVYGSLSLNSTPPGAKIYLYNTYTGEVTPHVFPYMDIGTYTVKIVGEGSSTTIEDLLVNPFEVSRYHVNLT